MKWTKHIEFWKYFPSEQISKHLMYVYIYMYIYGTCTHL